MRNLLLLALAAVAMLLTSCGHYPTPYRDVGGRVAYATQVGGKVMHTINADGGMAYTGDYEISWQHTMQTATTLGLSYINYLGALAKEITQRYQMGQITIQQRDAGLRAVEEALIAAKAGATESALSHGAIPNLDTIHPP